MTGLIFDGVFEDAENGGGGEIADCGEGLPAECESFLGELQGGLGGFEDLGAAGVEDPRFDVGEGEVVFGEEAVHVAAEVFEDDFGDVGRKDDAEASVANIPAHDVLGVAVESAAGGEDFGCVCGGDREAGFVAGNNYRGASIAEEAGGDEVGDGLVVVLPGEGAELDREEEGDLFGEGADVVRRAGDAGGTGDAAEAKDGGALDMRGERHPVDEAGVDGGRGNAGDGGEENGGDVCGGEAEGGEGAGDGCLAKRDGGSDPLIVGLLEAVELWVALDGENKVAGVDAAVCMEAGEQTGFGELVAPAVDESFRDLSLGVTVRREGSSYGGDLHSILWVFCALVVGCLFLP